MNDGRHDAVSFSITHPNELLFDRWRRREYAGETWVVIGVRPELLWQNECELFYRNAAKGSGSLYVPLARPRRPSAAEFERLFAEPETGPTRAQMGHRDCDTTDPQAEVMVFDVIEPSAFGAVYTEDVAIQEKAQQLVNDEGICDLVPIVVDPTLYHRRRSTDYYIEHGHRDLAGENADYLRKLGLEALIGNGFP